MAKLIIALAVLLTVVTTGGALRSAPGSTEHVLSSFKDNHENLEKISIEAFGDFGGPRSGCYECCCGDDGNGNCVKQRCEFAVDCFPGGFAGPRCFSKRTGCGNC